VFKVKANADSEDNVRVGLKSITIVL